MIAGKIFICLFGLLICCAELIKAATELTDQDLQKKQLRLPVKKIRLDVEYDKKVFVLDPIPILNYREIKGKDIEGCEIQQGQLIENLPAQFIRNKFPVGMDKRWFMWLRFTDSMFFIYREDKNSPINCATFSREGHTIDFWNIDFNVIKGIEGKDMMLLRDTIEETGPTVDGSASTFLYVAPKTMIYHQMNFLGKTVRSKVYTLDYDLSLIDAVAYNKRMYMINTYAMITMTINEDKMTKDDEVLISPNFFSQVGLTYGHIFIFVVKAADGYKVAANSIFSTEGLYYHSNLSGKKIVITKSGNRQLIFFVQEDEYNNKGTYYYILNPGVTKPSGLVFEKVPEITDQYSRIFEMNDRIHFVKENRHVMFTKGSQKSLISFVNTLPIIGVVYWSTGQYLSEDRFVTLADQETNGIFKLSTTTLTPPQIVCLPRLNSVERYEKFSVFNRMYEYRFDVVFHNTGNDDFEAGTLFQILTCILGGVAVLACGWVCFLQHRNDKDELMLNKIIKKEKAQKGGESTLNEDHTLKKLKTLQNEGSIMDDEDLDDEEEAAYGM